MKMSKAMNPFTTSMRSHENTVLEETAHMGPGYYSPKNNGIEKTEIEKSRNNMYSTVSVTKASGDISVHKYMNTTHLDPGSGDINPFLDHGSKTNLNRSIFGSSSGSIANETK